MQNTFTVAIDLDETLAATFEKIFNFGSEKYGWDIPFHEAVTRHDWWKIPGLGITEAGAHELFNEYCDTDPDDSFIPLVSWARNGVLELHHMGYSTHIVTARTESVRKRATQIWLSKHMPEFHFGSQVHFTNHYAATGSRTKWEICQHIGAKVLIDDNLDFLQNATTFWIFGILLDKPWNREGELGDSIVRASHWDEVPVLIEDYRKQLSQ